MSNSQIAFVNVKKISSAQWKTGMEELAIEEPLEISLQFESEEKVITKSIAVTMRTPGNDFELASGFLFTERILAHSRQLKNHSLDAGGNKILINLSEGVGPSLKSVERNFYTTSSCGVCGKSSIDAIRTASAYAANTNGMQVDAEVFQHLEKELLRQQMIFSKTGGLHASALFDGDGNFTMLREDVGRHNALDKLIGAAFLNDNLPLADKILLLSGRASFELIQKAAMAGIPIVAAVGAPSSLAVSLAKETGITLIGFLRNDRFNIYSGTERVHSLAWT